MLNRPRVLIVEGPGRGHEVRRVVEGLQFEVAVASTAAEGVDIFKEFSPDVVVLDLAGPDGAGLDALRQVRAVNPRGPVVLIAAPGTTEAALQALKDATFDCLCEPVDLDRLRAVLERAVEVARGMKAPSPPSATVEGKGYGLEALIAALQRPGERDLYARVIQAVDRVLFTEVLRQTHGNQLRASEILGIDRKTLRHKLRNLGLLPHPALVGAHNGHESPAAELDWPRLHG
jgi:DNA-binding NtrC family response regulator